MQICGQGYGACSLTLTKARSYLFEVNERRLLFRARQESDPVIHPISMNGVRVPACQKHNHLGVVINNSLSWSDHIDDVFRVTKCARHVGILNSLRKKLSKRCLTRIYKGYIRPRLEYACAVWSGGNTSKLLKLQQKFCRHWQHQVQLPNLSNRFKFHTLTLFYKIRNGLAPTYLSEILPETLALSSGRNLRRHVYPFPRINKSSTMQSFLPRAFGTNCQHRSRVPRHCIVLKLN